jgi:heme/copper-type cytochrome/quinol oxidase subunit 2
MQPRRARSTRSGTKQNLFFVPCFATFVTLVVAFSSPSAQEPAQNRRDFTIVAKDHVFTPNKIEVTQDDLVKITLTSEDRPTSFAIDAYRIVKRVAGNASITFEFRADQPGTFPFYCNLTKDPDCKDMRGVLNVRAK